MGTPVLWMGSRWRREVLRGGVSLAWAMRHGHSVVVGSEKQEQGLTEVVNVARGAVEQEFQISERLDAKARGQVTLAGQWFAVVQAVSAVAFAVKGASEGLLWAVGVSAVLGAGLLARTFICSSRVWKVRPEGAVHPQGLLDLEARALANEADGLSVMVHHYAAILQDRRLANKTRADALEASQMWWFLAMGVPLVQLILALAARLLTT